MARSPIWGDDPPDPPMRPFGPRRPIFGPLRGPSPWLAVLSGGTTPQTPRCGPSGRVALSSVRFADLRHGSQPHLGGRPPRPPGAAPSGPRRPVRSGPVRTLRWRGLEASWALTRGTPRLGVALWLL